MTKKQVTPYVPKPPEYALILTSDVDRQGQAFDVIVEIREWNVGDSRGVRWHYAIANQYQDGRRNVSGGDFLLFDTPAMAFDAAAKGYWERNNRAKFDSSEWRLKMLMEWREEDQAKINWLTSYIRRTVTPSCSVCSKATHLSSIYFDRNLEVDDKVEFAVTVWFECSERHKERLIRQDYCPRCGKLSERKGVGRVNAGHGRDWATWDTIYQCSECDAQFRITEGWSD